MRPYPAYKDSGIDWLGEIPAHWEIMPLKRKYAVQLGKMLSPEPSSLRDTLEPYLRAANIHWSGVDISYVKEMWLSPTERRQYDLRAGDLLVSEGGDVGRSTVWRDELPVCYFQNAINRIRSKFEDSTRFLFYWIYTLKHCGYIDEICEKATIRHFTAEKVSRLPVFIPPAIEQKVISAFLEHETVKIDRLVAKKERLIALLQEKRASIISYAVTKGLDADVSLKDSGVEWLGEIPAHWDILHLRRVVCKFVDYRGHTPEKVASGVPLITARNIKNGSIDFTLSEEFLREEDYPTWMVRGFPEIGDVLVTTEAPLGETAQINDENVALAQRVILLKMDKSSVMNDYLKYHFLSKSGQGELWSWATGSTAVGIKASHFKETLVTVPPIAEQRSIAAYLDRETVKLDAIIGKTQAHIGLLRERRTSLISAAVTGKIDVTHLTQASYSSSALDHFSALNCPAE